MLRAWEASQSLLWTHQSIRISQLISPVYIIHMRECLDIFVDWGVSGLVLP